MRWTAGISVTQKEGGNSVKRERFSSGNQMSQQSHTLVKKMECNAEYQNAQGIM